VIWSLSNFSHASQAYFNHMKSQCLIDTRKSFQSFDEYICRLKKIGGITSRLNIKIDN